MRVVDVEKKVKKEEEWEHLKCIRVGPYTG